MSQLGATNKKAFPRTNVATLRPVGLKSAGTEGDANTVNNNAMTSAQLDRQTNSRTICNTISSNSYTEQLNCPWNYPDNRGIPVV